MKQVVCLIVATLISLFSFKCLAALDEVQSRLLKHYEVPLRWDNIEGKPEWMSGVKPKYRFKQKMHIVRLKPGESVLVRIPSREMLRVICPDDPLTQEDLDISISNGSGLYAYMPIQEAKDGYSLLLSPEASVAIMARIMRPSWYPDAIEIGVFISRRETLGEIAPYRKIINLPTDSVKISDGYRPRSRTFWYLNPHEPLTIEITGPRRLALENRFIYPPTESRRAQTYWILINIDGNLSQVLEFETNPEMDNLVYVDGQIQVTSRQEIGYLEIPEGRHTLELQTTAGVHARLLEQKQPDYLLAGFNEPEPSAAEVREKGSPQILNKSLWENQEQYLQNIAETLENSPGVLERFSLLTVRDNKRHEGGLLGSMLLKEAAKQRRDYPRVDEHAEELLGIHTFYRDLLPSNKLTSEPQKFYRFIIRRLKKLYDVEQNIVASEQHLDALLDGVPGAYFVEIPNYASGENTTYHLPPRFSPSFLRVIVAPQFAYGQEFMVQFDDEPPLRFKIMTDLELPEEEYRLSPGEIGLAILRWQHREFDAATLGGPYSMIRNPALLFHPGFYEIPLPQEVRSITVFKVDSRVDSDSKLMLALQYRASKPYVLSESEYLNMVERLDLATQKLRQQFLSGLSNEATTELSDKSNVSTIELSNHWLPLIRFLRSRVRTFEASISPKPDISDKNLSMPEIEQLVRQTKEMEMDGQWISALEIWTQMYNATEDSLKEKALFSRIKALRHMGEDYLSEHLLRGIFLYGEEKTLRTKAFEYLEELYRKTEDHDALISLYTSAIMRQPTSFLITSLTEALLEGGYYWMALMLGLLLPESEQPTSTMLRAAFHLGWWNVFGNLLDRLGDDGERHYWMGQRACKRGYYDEALNHFYYAGSKREDWALAFEKGRAIHAALVSPDSDTRINAIIEWERWQAEHPGPFVWTEAPHLVTDYAGAETLYSIPRDLYMQTFMADPSRPVTVQVIGPVRLRTDVRPLHPPGSDDPIDGWLYIREPGELHPFPVNRNLTVEDLDIVGTDLWNTGREVSVEYSVGPGLHEIRINADTFPILTRIFIKRPEIPLSMLPPLTPDTLFAALHGKFITSFDIEVQEKIPYFDRSHVIILTQEREKPFVSMKSSDVYHKFFPFNLSERAFLRQISEEHPLYSHQGENDGLMDKIQALRKSPIKVFSLQARFFAEGEVDKALSLSTGNLNEDMIYRMVLFVWLAEHHPERYPEILAQAETLFSEHPEIPGLKPLLDRITRKSRWTPVTFIQSSAGIRYVDIQGWRPESPSLRIRKTLLPPFDPNDHILYDESQLVLSLSNLEPIELEVILTVEDVAYLPAHPITITCQLDENPIRTIPLTPDTPKRSFHVPMSSGEHSLRVGIDKRVENQFLRIQVHETLNDQNRSETEKIRLVREQQRLYHVATPQEPVQLELEGPARIRIDELREGKTLSFYQSFGPGWHSITLTPASDRKEALFRVFQKSAVAEESPTTPVRKIPMKPEPVLDPLFQILPLEISTSVELQDHFRLGGQEDGTWTISGNVLRRRNVQEDRGTQNKPEELFEVSLTHRYFHEGWRSYFHSQLLGHLRQNGGSTLGVTESLSHSPASLPFDLRLEGQLYVQRPESLYSGNIEWLGGLGVSIFQNREIGSRTSHTPSVSMFGRYLSMSNNTNYEAGYVDQDIFTPYKADHPTGSRVADTFVHRPWLDTIWFATGSMTSNTVYNPIDLDHVSLETGWKQLAGNLQASASYRYTHYFSDEDRDDSINRHILGLELSYEKWLVNQYRLEAGLNIRQELESGESSGVLLFSWHLGNGRAYRDFRPGEIDFLGIRKRRIPQKKNNSMYWK